MLKIRKYNISKKIQHKDTHTHIYTNIILRLNSNKHKN